MTAHAPPTFPFPPRFQHGSRLLVTLFALLVLCASPALATTQFLLGTIVSVDHADKSYGLWVQVVNYTGRGEEKLKKCSYGRGNVLFILDGKPASPEEALAVGRAAAVHDYGRIVLVSSLTPGPDAVMASTDPDNGVYYLRGERALRLGETAKERRNLDLVVDVVDGRIVDGVAILDVHHRPWAELDLTGLELGPGGPRGSTSFSVAHPALGESPVRMTCAVAPAVADGKLAGSLTGACEGLAGARIEGDLSGTFRPRAVRHDPGKAWMRIAAHDGFFFKDQVFVVCDLREGAGLDGGEVFEHKGGVTGEVRDTTLRLEGTKLSGGFTTSYSRHKLQGDYAFEIAARVIGNRYLFGTVTVTRGEERRTGFLRGGLVPADSPYGGRTDALEALFRETYPKKKNKKRRD